MLGIALEKPVFPAIVPCPHCSQNTLCLFDDILTDGLWLNCTACKAHGDIISFGAGLWNLSLPDTLTKFSASGVITENDANRVAGDYERCLTKQAAAEAFWADAESQVWNHGDDTIACRLRELGVKHEINGCYGLVGVAHHDQVAKICAEVGRPKPTRLRDDGAYLVLPFYDVPGRLTGFLLWQYNEIHESKQTFICLSGYRRQKPEAGYFMLATLDTPAPKLLRGLQFIVEDPLWAIQTQCNYLARHGQTLPIAVSYSGPEAESYGTTWGSFHFSRRIFHGYVVSPELISRASNAKGYAAVFPQSNRLSKPYGRAIDHAIFGRLSLMRSHAKTWQHALRDTVTGVSELNAQSFMQRLTIPHDRLGIFIDNHADKFSKDFKERVLAAVKMALAAPTRTQKRRIVIERDTGWWNQIGHQIANIRVVISKVLQADTGDKVYSGSIFMDNETYEFSDSAKRIERMGLLAYAATVMAPHGKLVMFDRSWNKSSHMIAMQLRPPKLINVSTKAGWDDHTNTFRFAKYEITHTGEIQPTGAWVARKNTKVFPEPAPIAPLPIHDLITPRHENSFVWVFTAAIIGNLVAPILRKDYIATAVSDSNFDLACRLGEVLACPCEKTTAFQRAIAYRFLNSITADATWPVIGHSAFNDDVFNPHAPKYFNRPLFLRLTRPMAVSSLSYGWQTIKSAPNKVQYDLDPLRYVLPSYIQRALKTRMHLFSAEESNIHKLVLDDLHGWLMDTYGDSFNLQHASAIMAYPNHAHTELMTELKHAILTEKIAVLPAPRKSKQASNYFVRRRENWWLNRRAVDRYFYSTRSVIPNWLAIIDLLQQDGVYTGEDVVHNMHGVLINTDWCDQFLMPSEPSSEKETG